MAAATQRYIALALVACVSQVRAQQTLKLSATLTLEKTDDKAKTFEDVQALVAHAKAQKLQSNVVRFLENAQQQMEKVMQAAKIAEERKLTEVPKEFTPGKYRVKGMPKLKAKKTTAMKMTAKQLQEKLQGGKTLKFDMPFLVTNATSLLKEGQWDHLRRQWSAARIMSDEFLEKDFRVEYWPPDKAKARLVGNMMYMEEPELVPFSRYIIICFHGTPAKPKLPGQNTEHCEQTVDASSMMRNASDETDLKVFPELKNALPVQSEFRKKLMAAAGDELKKVLGKGAKRWIKTKGQTSHHFFTFGPSGSGANLHAENGLPFYDILIHGTRRWLLMGEEEMHRVAEKAKEALEFDKTSAYMFFEEKLPELREEFGLKKYQEINQESGDLVFVPSGWFRVSLSLADSISYYETLLSDPDILKAVAASNVWRPQFGHHQLGLCYGAEGVSKLPKMEKQRQDWLKSALGQVKIEEEIQGIVSVLLQCGSTLALDKTYPTFKVRETTVCTPEVWKQCRKRLQAKLKEKKVDVSLSWLPEEAPRSIDDIPDPKAAKQEL